MSNPTPQQIDLFRNLFRGRDDVFAIRWDSKGKSGYSPAWIFDPHRFKVHKIHGGTLSNFPDKELRQLTDQEVLKHLSGKQFIGIYPLLRDNTSWFIAADFDQEDWEEACLNFLEICAQHELPAYLERSRSGEGGHVWLFFEDKIAASDSRALVFKLLRQCGTDSILDNHKSFDRLFPNQDYLSGKGYGNLIALPLHPEPMKHGNCCFLDRNLQPYPDQWKFLQSIQRVPTSKITELLESGAFPSHSTHHQPPDASAIPVTLQNSLSIPKHRIPEKLANFLKEHLVFANSAYYILKNSGRSTHKTPPFFKLLEESGQEVMIPRGFTGKVLRFCRANHIPFQFTDLRPDHSVTPFNSHITLLPHQQEVLQKTQKRDFGIIVAPPGSGKTIIGLKIIAEKKSPALIIVHRKQLMEQWMERIQHFLGIPKHEIGRIGQGKPRKGEKITVGMIQSLKKYAQNPDNTGIQNRFGTIIIDECHHIPAESYREAITPFAPRYQYGLTATPFRKGTDQRILFIHLGEIIGAIEPHEIVGHQDPKVIIRKTLLNIPFNPKTDTFETLSKYLVHDSARNRLIADDILKEAGQQRRVMVITERREHIEAIRHLLKQNLETITLSGEDSATQREQKMEQLKAGQFQVLITTGQYLGEGFDIQGISTLFLVYPFSFKGKLIQYIGRVQRSASPPVVFDYHDDQIGYLHRMFLNRNAHYRRMHYHATLFDEVESADILPEGNLLIRKRVSVPFEHLEFNYAHFAVDIPLQEPDIKLRFEIENHHIRPEFSALLPYFVKALKLRSVVIEIMAEFEHSVLISQSAISSDLERINREIIDSIRFRITQRVLPWMKPKERGGTEMFDFEQLKAGHPEADMFLSSDDLLSATLRNKQSLHYKHLRYLATQHASDLVKVRFVLQPFAFVFVLRGNTELHAVLETLDTEEATYVWQFDRFCSLKENLDRIDLDLQRIKGDGKQTFLMEPPSNFSRVIHLYHEPDKGFVFWRDQLEQRLI